MKRAASLAFRGVTLSIASTTLIGFSTFHPELYLETLMSSDMFGKALLQRKVKSKQGVNP